MADSCVILDIGGVLEITPETGWVQRWERRLDLPPGTVQERMHDVWRAGSVGGISEREVNQQVAARLGLDVPLAEAF
ncbi:HAD family phosphatase, partial [Streptomyces sp. 900105245]